MPANHLADALNYGGGEVGMHGKIQDGPIYLDAINKTDGRLVDGGDIVTDEEFENFHLKYELEDCPKTEQWCHFLYKRESKKISISLAKTGRDAKFWITKVNPGC